MQNPQAGLKESERCSCLEKHHELAREAEKNYLPDYSYESLKPLIKKIIRENRMTIILLILTTVILITFLVELIQLKN